MDLFRKSALDNRFQREEDAEVLRVSPPHGKTIILFAVLLLSITSILLLLSLHQPSTRLRVSFYLSGNYPVIASHSGLIQRLAVEPGDQIRAGSYLGEISTADSLEIPVYSGLSGTVRRIYTHRGDSITSNGVLLDVDAQEQLVGCLSPQLVTSIRVNQRARLEVTTSGHTVDADSVRVANISEGPVGTTELPAELRADAGSETVVYPVIFDLIPDSSLDSTHRPPWSVGAIYVDFSDERPGLLLKLYKHLRSQ
jgi:hypothetical protein